MRLLHPSPRVPRADSARPSVWAGGTRPVRGVLCTHFATRLDPPTPSRYFFSDGIPVSSDLPARAFIGLPDRVKAQLRSRAVELCSLPIVTNVAASKLI
eukprot:jgi/Botrbrau1/4247/Bobra.0044s0042.1